MSVTDWDAEHDAHLDRLEARAEQWAEERRDWFEDMRADDARPVRLVVLR